MSLSDFEILSKIGKGSYSTVFKVRRILDNNIYALKKVKFEGLSRREKKNALNEVRIMASIQHPNVIGYKESFISEAERSLCLVMEYADSGDLFQRLQNCRFRNVRLSEPLVWSLLTQLAMGLKTLHDLGVLHRDIKSANVFLNKDGTVKLGDLNVSKVSKDGFLNTQTGTPYYASPEVWTESKYDNKVDIWSLGCVLYESIVLRPPFNAGDIKGLCEKVLQGTYEPLPKGYSEDLVNLIDMMLSRDSNLRPSCDDLLNFDCVKANLANRNLKNSLSGLLKPIKIINEVPLVVDLLPVQTYDISSDVQAIKNSISEKSIQIKPPAALPGIKSPKKHTDDNRASMSIFDRESRINRIKSIYLSPRNYLSPRARKKNIYQQIIN